ncbi:MAG: hypothetical protein AAGK78_16660, partial [Planctomycetota bacterium]
MFLNQPMRGLTRRTLFASALLAGAGLLSPANLLARQDAADPGAPPAPQKVMNEHPDAVTRVYEVSDLINTGTRWLDRSGGFDQFGRFEE